MSLSKSITQLDDVIERARDLLDNTHIRSGHLLLQHVIIRYLNSAIAAAEVNRIVVQARHPSGAAPVTRSLFEIGVDIMYLLASPDPHKEAARTLLWSVLEWDRQWKFHEGVDQADPSMSKHGQQGETIDEAMKGFIEQLRTSGEDTRALEELYAEYLQKGKTQRHWSGKTRKDMIDVLGKSGDQTLHALLTALWPILSDEAHPSAGWHRTVFQFTEDGNAIVPDPALADDGESVRFADQTTSLLLVIHQLVERYYSQDRDELSSEGQPT